MKLRIRGNSVRLRLTRSEVEEFSRVRSVEETIEFGIKPHQRFVYALAVSDNENLSALFEDNRLTIFLPKRAAREWAESNQVGIRAEQTLENGKTLGILVEKDFACLDARPGEDESDAFPNPLAGKAC